MLDLAALQGRCIDALDVSAVYSGLTEMGLAYGPAFQGLRSLWRGDDESVAEVALPAGVGAAGYGVHPALLDAAFHALVAAMGGTRERQLLLPLEIGGFAVYQRGAEAAWVHARLHDADGTSAVAEVTLADASGAVLAEVTGLRVQRADRDALRRTTTEVTSEAFYRLAWQEAPLPDTAGALPEGSWLVVGESGATATALCARLPNSVLIATADIQAAFEGAGKVAGVVCLWEAGANEATPATALRVATDGLSAVQALASRAPVRLWWVTEAAVAVRDGDGVAVATSPIGAWVGR